MNPALPIVSALLLPALASAQLSASYVAKSKLTASCFYSGQTPIAKELPAGTDLSKGASLSASSITRGTCGFSLNNTASAISIRLTQSATGRYSSSYSYGSGYAGAHQTTLLVKSTKPTKVMVQVAWSVSNTNRGSSGGGSVDIGDDGSYEFSAGSASRTQTFPAVIDASGLAITTSTQARASGNSTYRSSYHTSSLSVTILPPETCLFFSHGTPCGPTLSAKNGFEDRITITATGGAVSGAGLLVFGLTRTSLSLPGTTCLLLVNPLLSVPIAFDANGVFSFTAQLPPSRPIAFPLQVGSLGATLGTSNALTIICP